MNPNKQDFHVVGIGASAGGLDALEKLFESFPANTGAAFVVVQHLSPDFESHMEQLLSRKTEMRIRRVTNAMHVEPNTIYLIPPSTEMAISNGQLLLTERDRTDALNLAIDHFFRSLANDCRQRAIGIILSGSGSDGARGVVSIADAGGLVACQSESSAKFDDMPRNAQDTGAAHLILPPDKIANAITTYIREDLTPAGLSVDDLIDEDVALEMILSFLRREYTIDFSQYKLPTIRRRIKRRMSLTHKATIEEYGEHVRDDMEELNSLYKDLLIGVTKFFRDEDAFTSLAQSIIPKIIENSQQNGEEIRVWLSGCATGEEAYSVAILFDEAMRKQKSRTSIKIFATDVHRSSLTFAGAGVYQESALSDLSSERRETYFSKTEKGFMASPEIRKMIVFAPHDLTADAPFTRLDLIICRNLLIYLKPTTQKKIISLFHFGLRKNSFLFLGPSETPGELSDEFETEDKKWRIYRKRRDVHLNADIKIPLNSPSIARPFAKSRPRPRNTPESQLLSTYDNLLDRYMPASFLIDEDAELIHSFGGAEKYLILRGGRTSTNLLDLIHDDLKSPVSGAIQHAARDMKAVRYNGIPVHFPGRSENVQLVVDPMRDPRTEIVRTLITLNPTQPAAEPESKPTDADSQPEQDVDIQHLSRSHISSLESELRYTKENLQATVEELETSNEELQSTNEELISSNEELQSTNEELQSVNEELHTVNAEYQRKIIELNETTDDMNNLFINSEVGVVFLDSQLQIRRFTPRSAKTFGLIPQDIGRPIEGFLHSLTATEVVDDVRDVISTGEPFEQELEDRSGNFWLLKASTHQGQDSGVGIVLTLVDINSVKDTDIELERYREVVEASVAAITRTEIDGTITHWNAGAERLYGYTKEEAIGKQIQMLTPSGLLDETENLIQRFQKGEKVRNFQSVRVAKDGKRKHIILNAAPVKNVAGDVVGCSSVSHDVTQKVELAARSRVFERAFQSTLTAMIITDPRQEDNPIVFANPGFETLTGYHPEEVIGQNCRFLQGEETNPKTVQKIRRAIRHGESCRAKIVNYRKDGAKFWNELVITPVRDSEGDVSHYIGVQFDATRQQNAEIRLSRERDIAEAANVAKSNFVANMSHEIRTPLTTVVGMTELLLDHEVDKSKHDTLQMIHQSGRHLVNLVNDILDISKIEAGKLESHVSSVSPVNILDDVAAMMGYKASEKNIEFDLKYKGLIPQKIQTDPIRFRQILFNLTGNAVKFTESGSITVLVQLVDKLNRPKLKIEVEDTGVGFDNEQVEKLFGQFNQLDETPTRAKGGTGLGLYISRRLAEHLGGRLSAKGKIGFGSKFTFTLPIGDLAGTILIDPASQESSSRPESNSGHEGKLTGKILVVEDTPGIQLLVTRILEKSGMSVVAVDNGTKALARLNIQADGESTDGHEADFDLIVLDMHMPGISGYETAEKIRELGATLPIIALTASAMQGDKEKCIAAGCDAYLTKPIDREKLIEQITELLRTNDH